MRRASWCLVVPTILAAMAAQAQEPARPRPELPPRDTAAAPARVAPTGSISGIVTTAETGTPLRRVNVKIERVDGSGRTMPAGPFAGNERAALTTDDGRFEFRDLGVGTWRITASKGGYLTQQHGQRRPFETARPVMLTGGQRLDLKMALGRAGAINGRVFDEYGEPVTGARVQLLRARTVRQHRQLQPVGQGDFSDDTGAFRLHSLAPGEYYVTASIRVAPLDSVVQTTYAPTYYPGTANFAEAQRIVVGTGAEVSADFQVRPVRTARITGFVQDSSGAPASAFLNLVAEATELGDGVGAGGATREDGSFIIPDVAPGAYMLYATLRGGGYDAEVTSMPLNIYEDDVSGITLATAKPGSMRVTLVPDVGITRPVPDSVAVVARSVRAGSETRHGAAERASPSPIHAPPAAFHLSPDLPEEWMLKAVLVGDVDVIDSPIDLKGQQDVPVRLVLSDKVTDVSGTVTLGNETQAVRVVVFAEDAGRWRTPSRFIRTAAVDGDGRFRLRGLPAGVRYLAIAVEGLEEGDAADPELLTRMKDQAVSFPLAEGEQRVLGLPVVQP